MTSACGGEEHMAQLRCVATGGRNILDCQSTEARRRRGGGIVEAHHCCSHRILSRSAISRDINRNKIVVGIIVELDRAPKRVVDVINSLISIQDAAAIVSSLRQALVIDR